jgi:PAS domain S-box-containing protein
VATVEMLSAGPRQNSSGSAAEAAWLKVAGRFLPGAVACVLQALHDRCARGDNPLGMSAPDARDLVLQTLLLEAISCAEMALCVYDDDGRYAAVNERACAILGYTRDELLGHDVGDFTDGGIDRSVLTSDRRREGVRVVRRKDGSTVPVAYVVVPTTVGGLPYFVAVWWVLEPADERVAGAA